MPLQTAPNMFTGVMDADSDPRFVDTQNGNYIYAENILNGDSARPGAVTNMRGSVSYSPTFPAGGSNTCIGTVEDKLGNSIVSFWYNSSANHTIQRWYRATGEFLLIAQGSWLDFSLDRRIHDAYIVDGKILRWTDVIVNVGDLEISGNEPRSLNMDRAYLAGKSLMYELYAGFDGQSQFTAGAEYVFDVKDSDGITLSTATVTFADDTYTNDPQGGLLFIKSELEGGDFGDYIEIEACPCKLVITVMTTEQTLEMTGSGDTRTAILVPLNHYISPLTDMEYWMARTAKVPPTCAPLPSYINDSTVTYNNVRDGRFQFRSRYRFIDGEVGPWSAISETAINNSFNGGPIETLNAIYIQLTDNSITEHRLNDARWLQAIRYVDVAFRDGPDDTFKLIRSIPICEIGVTDQWTIFKNDALYQTIPSDDPSITSDVQVLANDHHVPRLTSAMCTIAGEDGNMREVMAGTLEGYNGPGCMDVTLEAVVYDNEELIDIIGTVEIISHADFPNDDIDYSNYALGGFVVYLAGTPFYGISDNPADGSGTGAFTIPNVPKGQYSLRVASYQCRYGDEMGPRYNLLNGIEWQKTSMPMVDCAGSVAENGFTSERILDLYSFIGTEFDLDTEVGYGPIQVHNAHYGETNTPGIYMKLVEVYALDNNGLYEELEDRTGATSVERIGVDFHVGVEGSFDPTPYENTYTDHNGYSWSLVQHGTPGGILDISVRPVIIAWGGDDTGDPQPYHVYAAGANGFKGLFSNEPTEITDLSDQNAIPVHPTLLTGYINFAFNHDPDWTTANSYILEGQCVDISDNPIANVIIWMFTNGRTEKTDALGQYTITTYGYGTPSRFAIQELRPAYLPDTSGAYQPTPFSDTEAFDFVDGQASPSTFVYGFAGGIVTADRYVKAGGKYKVAFLYEDDPGRVCGVIPIGEISVPFHTEINSYLPQQIKYTVATAQEPPLWATKYRVLITRDSFYLTYKHLPITEVKYANISPVSREILITSYVANTATHILLGLKTKLPNDPNAVPLLNMFRDTFQNGYHGKYGDRVRYMLDETLTPIFIDRVLEVDVEGEYFDGSDYYVIIPYTEIHREVKKSWVFEFFTPKGYEEEIYYESGTCYALLEEPHRHPASIQDQHLPQQIDPQPAIGIIKYGDTYWRFQEFELNNGDGAAFVAENETRNDHTNKRCEDIGRPRVYVPDDGERFYFNRIRFSGTYVPDSNINDLSVYGALDFIALNRMYGAIRKVAMVSNVMVAFCEDRIQPIYVGKGRMLDLSGNATVGRADTILNIADETLAEAGTRNPESVAVWDGRACVWDVKRGKVWRFGPDGLTPIITGKQNYFRHQHDERIVMSGTENFVHGAVDRRYGLYWLKFDDGERPGPENSVIDIPEDCIVFDIKKGGWVFHFTESIDMFGALNDNFFAFSGERQDLMYSAGTSDAYNETFGAAFESLIQFPVNQAPQTEKDWLNIRIMAQPGWYISALSIPAGAAYPGGMTSRIPFARFVYRESSWVANFLRDSSDPHTVFTDIVDVTDRETAALLRGRELKGYVMIVSLTPNNSAVSNILYRTDVTYADSQNTP